MNVEIAPALGFHARKPIGADLIRFSDILSPCETSKQLPIIHDSPARDGFLAIATASRGVQSENVTPNTMPEQSNISYYCSPEQRQRERERESILGETKSSSVGPSSNTDFVTHTTFAGRIVCIGFGSIGRGVLPLILRHIGGLTPDRITVLTAHPFGMAEARKYQINFKICPLTRDNYRSILTPMLGKGDFLLNLSVDVCSVSLIELCGECGALYLDTCIEPWPGHYTDSTVAPSLRSNHALREQALAMRQTRASQSTAVLTHGANPGLVSHLVKQALLNIAKDTGFSNDVNPTSRAEWAKLAADLNVKVVHIAERDNQQPTKPKEVGEFVNTWSVDGFVAEGCQPAELGWGTHEKKLPHDGMRHEFGSDSAIYLMRPGAATRVRSWTPNEGHYHGFLITHGESISIADYLTHRNETGQVLHRPTVHYAYHPSDSAVASVHELAEKNWKLQQRKRVLVDEIVSGGIDELGVLLAGHAKNAYWFGSQLSIDEARLLAPHNSATSLQVTAAVLAGMVWAIENPERGIVEPEDMDFRRSLEICLPYLGPVIGEYTQWTPLHERDQLFPEPGLDHEDPWQFANVRV